MGRETFSLIYPEDYQENEQDKLTNFDFIKTLKINEMISIKKESFRGMPDLELEGYFTKNPEVLEYRLGVVGDLTESDELYTACCKAIPLLQDISDIRRVLGSDYTLESSLSSIKVLEMYLEIVELFGEGFKNTLPLSKGMKCFQEKISEIRNSKEYEALKRELAKMEMNISDMKSITLGVNIDGTLQVKEAGVVSINRKEFRQGNIVDKLLNKNTGDQYVCITSLAGLQKGMRDKEHRALNQAVYSALNTIFVKTVRSWDLEVQKYFFQNTTFFLQLLNDLRFITACVKFILEMKEKGIPMCKPEIFNMQDKRCELKNVYNPMLAKKLENAEAVGNDFTYDENGRFYIVTGPNHGGKSIFAYSIGMVQALFQLGVYIPAEKAILSPVSGIYTHFPVSDEDNYGKGRLESECARLSNILYQLSDTDMLLLDESLSSTSGIEAEYIASQVITGIGVIGCCGLFVTHIHELSQKLSVYNEHPENRGKIDNLVAQMQDKKEGIRSYRIKRVTPDGLSYARDISKKYGLELEAIIEHIH